MVHRRRITRILHGPNVECIMPGSAEAVSSDTPSIPAPQLEQTVGATSSNRQPQRASSPTRLSSAIAFGQLKSDSDLEETIERTQPVVVNCVGVLPWATRYCSASFVWEHPRTPESGQKLQDTPLLGKCIGTGTGTPRCKDTTTTMSL